MWRSFGAWRGFKEHVTGRKQHFGAGARCHVGKHLDYKHEECFSMRSLILKRHGDPLHVGPVKWQHDATAWRG